LPLATRADDVGCRVHSPGIALLGVLFGAALAAASLFTPSPLNVDELGLFNPVYTFLTTGHMTYPIYYSFDTMVVHPPVHYLELGWLMRLGVGLPYAEALPPLVFGLLSLWLICRSRLPYWAQVGLLVATFTVATISLPEAYYSLHGVRPDMHLALAWIAGLVALETARLDDWNLRRLALGAMVLTYASTLHYYGWVAVGGIAVYVLWALKTRACLGARVGVLVGGGLVVGLPYMALFVVPNWAAIRDISGSVQSSGGVAEAIGHHFEFYAFTATFLLDDVGHRVFAAALLLPPLLLHVPLALIGCGLLFTSRATRGLALASLPVPLFVLLYSQGKSAGYYLPEMFVYVAGVIGISVRIATAGSRRLLRPGASRVMAHVGPLALGAAVLLSSPLLFTIDPLWFPRPHAMEVARAASQQLLGPNAFVGGRQGMWFTGGGTKWHQIESDFLWRQEQVAGLTPAQYFAYFDAVADHNFMSDVTSNADRSTLSSLYVDDTLHLRGFYLADPSPNATSLVLFDTRAAQAISGFATVGRRTVKFEPAVGGEYRFVATVCAAGTAALIRPEDTVFVDVLTLPGAGASAAQREVTIVLAATHRTDIWQQLAALRCTLKDMVEGSLRPVDQQQLVSSLKTSDRPIEFTESVAQLFSQTTIAYAASDRPGVLALTVSGDSQRGQLAGIDVSVNKALDGSATGEWQVLGSAPVSGSAGTASFTWDTSEVGAGKHLIAINLRLADGITIWWYDQPRRTYTVK